jgi:hypothetical protein
MAASSPLGTRARPLLKSVYIFGVDHQAIRISGDGIEDVKVTNDMLDLAKQASMTNTGAA